MIKDSLLHGVLGLLIDKLFNDKLSGVFGSFVGDFVGVFDNFSIEFL